MDSAAILKARNARLLALFRQGMLHRVGVFTISLGLIRLGRLGRFIATELRPGWQADDQNIAHIPDPPPMAWWEDREGGI